MASNSRVSAAEQQWSSSDWVFVLRILSADCAKPVFRYFGLQLEERHSAALNEAAKDCYRALLGNAESIYHIDFSPERISSAVETFLSRVAKLGGRDAARRVGDFGNWYCELLGEEETTPDALWSILLTELASGHPNAVPPDRISKAGLDIVLIGYREVLEERDRLARLVAEGLEAKRISAWDKKLLTQTPKLPRQLSDAISSLVQARGFRRFWRDVKSRLDAQDLEAMKDWLVDQASVILPSVERSHLDALDTE